MERGYIMDNLPHWETAKAIHETAETLTVVGQFSDGHRSHTCIHFYSPEFVSVECECGLLILCGTDEGGAGVDTMLYEFLEGHDKWFKSLS